MYYIIGGGISGLHAAVLLLKDGIHGQNITIIEANNHLGGLFFGRPLDDNKSFIAHTVRTFDEPSYKHTKEIWQYVGIWNDKHLRTRNINKPVQYDSKLMRQAFLAISKLSDGELNNKSVLDVLSDKVCKSPAFRYFFHLTGIHECHSALYLKRYMTHTHCKIPHNWLLRSVKCDYESIIIPIVEFLKNHDVNIQLNRKIHDLVIRNDQVICIDDVKLNEDDKIIMTMGPTVNVNFDKDVLLPVNDVVDLSPLRNMEQQPHCSMWALTKPNAFNHINEIHDNCIIEDFIYIDCEHPWKITMIYLGTNYYEAQPKDQHLFYIALNDLSSNGVHINKSGMNCTNDELIYEALRQLDMYAFRNYMTVTVDFTCRNIDGSDRGPIFRFMPGEDNKILLYPDTLCNNLALIGERVKVYNAPVPTTEWCSESAYRAVRYLLYNERYRMSSLAYKLQEALYSVKFVANFIKHKIMCC